MNKPQTRIEVVGEEAGFRALEAQWHALWLKAHGRYYQRFDLCLLAWQHVAQPRGRKLRCIVIREDGELVLVWPLVTYRRVLWKYLLPLSPDAADYTSMLVEDGPRAAELVEQAWNAACKLCGADFVHLPYMYEGSELHRVALRSPHILGRTRHESWTALMHGESDWNTFCRSLGTMSGKKPGQFERRLAKEGNLQVRLLDATDTEGITSCVRAMLEWKRHWSDRVGKKGIWLFSPYYERFLIATLTYHDAANAPRPLARLFAVTLDGTPIAVSTMSYGNPVANAVIASFDPAYGRFGAGVIAWENAVRWAFEQHFDVDFGVGSERFKSFWSRNNRSDAWTMQIANTIWGLVGYRVVRGMQDVVAALRGKPRSSESLEHRKG